MPRQRREAITDSNIATRGLSVRAVERIEYGTHAHATYGGTVTFKHGAFRGSPTILLQPLGGYRVLGGGTMIPVQVISRYSGSFTYYGSPRHGTFAYLAVGSFPGPR